VSIMPEASTFWGRLHRVSSENLIYAEDSSGLCVLRAFPSGETKMYVNGISHSSLPYGTLHAVLGMLPVMIHHNPKDIAVIGLGSGETAYAMGGRQGVQEITCFEIVKPVAETLDSLDRMNQYPGLKRLLQDSRMKHLLTDGRAFIMHKNKKYDVIEADALHSYTAFSGNLYSYEYFMLLRSRLKPGGLAVTWAPTRRVLDTFVKAFPYVLVLRQSAVLIGSNQPLVYDPRLVKQRLESSFTRAYFERGGINVDRFAAFFLTCEAQLFPESYDRTKILDVNTDLFPKDEYLVPPEPEPQAVGQQYPLGIMIGE